MLGADIFEGFKKAGIPRHYHADEPIVLENEPTTGMYLILKGEVRVLRRTPAGEQIEVATMGAGQTMGEVSLELQQREQQHSSQVRCFQVLIPYGKAQRFLLPLTLIIP